MRNALLLLVAALCFPAFSAEKAAPLSGLGKMPIREITVFKDGHVFVAQEGSMPVDRDGNVTMDYLPTPIIGTFWPYAKGARLAGVTASQRRVVVERTALTVRELLEANVGAEALITEGTNRYAATIVGFPTRSVEELESTAPPNSGDRLPERGSIVLLKTAEGTRVVGIDRIQEVVFRNEFKTAGSNEEFRNLLTLKLDWAGRNAAKNADVGLLYLQKGIRWIPSYKVTLDGKGNAVVKLQATVLNEMADFQDANVNLVIGVPTFAFKETLDPISLQQTAAQLSQYFAEAQQGKNSLLAANFGNGIMTQTARMGEYRQTPAAPTPPVEGEADGDRNEDLFIFNINKLSLKRGERIVVPVAEYTIPYEDIFTVDLPFSPPPEIGKNYNSAQQQDLARLFDAPKVMHKVRLTNKGKYPITTAPALIVRDNRVVAQGMTTYTAVGGQSDLAVTTAVDIALRRSDSESERTPNALRHNDTYYTRIRMNGKISLTNHRAAPAKIEITRHVLGNVDKADNGGTISKVNVFESDDYIGSTAARPYWWHWYGWPAWWSQFNGVAQIKWTIDVTAGKSIDLGYDWHYFWR